MTLSFALFAGTLLGFVTLAAGRLAAFGRLGALASAASAFRASGSLFLFLGTIATAQEVNSGSGANQDQATHCNAHNDHSAVRALVGLIRGAINFFVPMSMLPRRKDLVPFLFSVREVMVLILLLLTLLI